MKIQFELLVYRIIGMIYHKKNMFQFNTYDKEQFFHWIFLLSSRKKSSSPYSAEYSYDNTRRGDCYTPCLPVRKLMINYYNDSQSVLNVFGWKVLYRHCVHNTTQHLLNFSGKGMQPPEYVLDTVPSLDTFIGRRATKFIQYKYTNYTVVYLVSLGVCYVNCHKYIYIVHTSCVGIVLNTKISEIIWIKMFKSSTFSEKQSNIIIINRV